MGRKLKRLVAMSLYYGIAKRLPSRGPLWEPSRRIRQELCRRFLDECGVWVNISTDVHLGTGRNVRIGNRSGPGPGCRVYGGLIMGEQVMVGPDVAFRRTTALTTWLARWASRAAPSASRRGSRTAPGSG
ncbi:MAG: hypothetical protein WAN22_32575 [Solirubrobacteraceae bacterium]